MHLWTLPSSHPSDNQLVLLDWDTCGQSRKDGVIMGVEALDTMLLADCILLELPIVPVLPYHQDHQDFQTFKNPDKKQGR